MIKIGFYSRVFCAPPFPSQKPLPTISHPTVTSPASPTSSPSPASSYIVARHDAANSYRLGDAIPRRSRRCRTPSTLVPSITPNPLALCSSLSRPDPMMLRRYMPVVTSSGELIQPPSFPSTSLRCPLPIPYLPPLFPTWECLERSRLRRASRVGRCLHPHPSPNPEVLSHGRPHHTMFQDIPSKSPQSISLFLHRGTPRPVLPHHHFFSDKLIFDSSLLEHLHTFLYLF